MDFMNMFEEMMEGLEPSKKETSKKENKGVNKKEKSAPKKKEAKVKVDLPLEVVSAYAEPFILDHVGEETKESDLQTVMTHLATQLGFKGILHEMIIASYEERKLYLGEKSFVLDEDTDVQVDFPVTVAYGPVSAEYTIPEEISMESDTDEITVKMVAEKFISSFSGFETAKWSYDPKAHLIIPYWESDEAVKEKDVVDFPCTLYYGGESDIITVEQFENTGSLVLTAKDICEDKLPVSIKSGSVFLVKAGANAYRIVFTMSHGSNPISVGGNAAGSTKKKVEEKYELPLNLVITGFSQKLTSEDFDGKDKVIRKDVEEYLMPKYPSLFKDSRRKPMWFYCKELSSLEIAFLSGEKGGL